MRHPLAAALALVAALAAAPRAHASVFVQLTLEPESALTPAGGEPTPLVGSIDLWLGELPPSAPTPLEVLALEIATDTISASLDVTLESPGLGVAYQDETFLIPSLFLVIDDGTGAIEIAIPDVSGVLDASDPALLALEASFDVETESGLVNVAIVAAPEPCAATLAGSAAAALALLLAHSSRRASGT